MPIGPTICHVHRMSDLHTDFDNDGKVIKVIESVSTSVQHAQLVEFLQHKSTSLCFERNVFSVFNVSLFVVMATVVA